MTDTWYAEWWLAHYGVYPMERPSWMALSVALVGEQERTHPGFTAALRSAALGRLHLDDDKAVCGALAALAVVGAVNDVPVIQTTLQGRSPDVQRDVRTAIFEIEHRAPAV